MKNSERNRIYYLAFIIIVIILGLGSRSDTMPRWVHMYMGDILWGLMIFLIIGMIFKKKGTYWIGIVAIGVTFFIEISQLYQADWINAIRYTKLGGLVLGYGFLWSDLLAYTIGILIGVILENKY
ncbi:ribosomal maturation YjgA family protein [Alkaliphilus peptidifermentans]|uniref:DUF2809 domain-containing protein n=1 Tax=Alkaliphilus peptidifermentans DSM 18978 TaxID=1120976 RepID=A0A1G5GZI7_9FIRM|nr:DUF2809 domain-containing protein [Alkaliphilus peptidifermentans]SCY56530.1 Protein of unknown function [Alkaliphilus peptidifermentans DSM 18978]